MLYRSPRGVYRDYTQDHVLPIHSFQPSQQGAICDSVPPGADHRPRPLTPRPPAKR